MSLPVSSQKDLYDLFITVLQDQAPDLTDTLEGSVIDTLAGVFSVAASELSRLTVDQFNKTFIELANGPEVTGGPDDLQTLAVDHFGAAFARPQAVQAVDVITFSRANNSNGVILIPAGTVVKTQPDADGNAQRYSTNSAVTLTNSSAPSDTSISVACTAVVAGAAGSAASGTINVIESSLLDPTIFCTNAGNATGADAQTDSEYRETIRQLIESLSGATIQAVEAKALTISGVQTATAIEQALTVIQYNTTTNSTVGSSFTIPQAILYIADQTGTASTALINLVKAAIEPVRACGVSITVKAATPSTINWTASITLNPLGANYATLSSDTSLIKAALTNYINTLPVGTSFSRATANAAILSIYGASGTNDLTAFTTSAPSGDVTATATTKFTAGTMSIV